jgi:hypothetical protein
MDGFLVPTAEAESLALSSCEKLVPWLSITELWRDFFFYLLIPFDLRI